MKFGKKIQEIASEWAEVHYINYKGLKKIISSLEQREGTLSLAAGRPLEGAGQSSAQGAVMDASSKSENIAFFFQLERELEKVFSQVTKISQFAGQEEAHSHQQPTLSPHKIYFTQVNATGFRKILKKFDKRFKSTTKELYLTRQIDVQPCFNNEFLTSLADLASSSIVKLDLIIQASKGNDMVDYAHEEAEAALESCLSSKSKTATAEVLNQYDSKIKDDPSMLSRLIIRHLSNTSMDCINALIELGNVDFNYSDDFNLRSMLHEAVICDNIGLVQLCLTHGSNPTHLDYYGRSPLHYATMYGHLDCLIFILGALSQTEQSQVIDLVDHDGNNPLIDAISGGHTECVRILMNHHAKIEPASAHAHIPLCLACQHGHQEIVTLLLAKGASLIPTAEGMYPIHLACRNGHHEITSQLIQHGADIECKDSFYGFSPLFFAAQEGHLKCVQLLIDAGARCNYKDQEGWIPLTYALYHSHLEIANLLKLQNVQPEPKVQKPAAPSSIFSNRTNPTNMDIDMDEIPSLSLPPPMMPFRIYGHSYLDKKMQLTVHFSSLASDSIKLFDVRQPTSLKLIVTSNPDLGMPYSRILPISEDQDPLTFTVDNFTDFSLSLEIFPTFGSHYIAKSIILFPQIENALNYNINGSHAMEKFVTPLIDSHLNCVGQLSFGVSIVTPFSHPKLSIGGKTETYWKSTQPLINSREHSSLITASSLSEEYIQLTVQLTQDGHVVVFPGYFIVDEGISHCLASLRFEQAKYLFSKTSKPTRQNNQTANDYVDIIYSSLMTLSQAMALLPDSIGVSIVLKYPTPHDRETLNLTIVDANLFIDKTLETVYSNTHTRVIFASYNVHVCTAINRKQPNYGVFFGTSCGYNSKGLSIKEAIKFAKTNNMLGIICNAEPLTVKEAGLLLASCGELNTDAANAKIQEEMGVDAIIVNRVFKYNVNI